MQINFISFHTINSKNNYEDGENEFETNCRRQRYDHSNTSQICINHILSMIIINIRKKQNLIQDEIS